MDAERHARFKPTILLPGRGVQLLGALLLLLGLVLPWWLVRERTQEYAHLLTEKSKQQSGALRPEMVLLPTPGSVFPSAAEKTRFQHLSRRPFAIAITEVTRGQYQRVAGDLPRASQDRVSGDGRGCAGLAKDASLPMSCVTFHEALSYCNRLSELEGLRPCYRLSEQAVRWTGAKCEGYRLPTLVEWMYAAKAGTATRDAETHRAEHWCRFANVADQSALEAADRFPCDDGYRTLAPVASLYPNAWFLYDMAGNVSEWVWLVNETGEDAPEQGAVRGRPLSLGGNWLSGPSSAQDFFSMADDPVLDADAPSSTVGFRIVRSLAE